MPTNERLFPIRPPGSAALLLLGALSVGGCEVNLNSEGIVSRETKTFQVSGAPDVELDTFDGAIEVHSWDRSEEIGRAHV